MSAPSNTRLLSEFRTFARWAGSAAAATGMLVLLGWALDIATLKRVLPHLSSMKPNTAVGLILTGVSLLLLQREWPGGRRGRSASVVSQLCAGAVVLIGALTLTEHWTGWDLRIDQILFQDTSALPGELHPLRMGMIAGLSFVLTGCALLWFDVETRNARRPAEWLSFLAGLIALVVLIAYAYSVESIVGLASDTEVALHTAVTFALLSIGILCARPDRGTMALVTADSIAGLITRRFLPVAIVVPALLGWLRLLGQRAAYYGTEFGLALFTTSNIVIFVLLILASSRQIDRFDARRRRAEEEINRLFTFSQDLLCVAGFDGYFKRLNPAWEKALGYTLEELKAKPYVEFLHPEDRAATLAEAGGLSSGQLTSALENRYQAKDGSYKWLSWNSYPLPEEQLIYGSARDITERKEAEEHVRVLNATLEQQVSELATTNQVLAAINKELEAFTYSVSHDLRAPLRHIDGFTRILEQEYGSQLDPSASRYLQRIRQGTRHMGQLVDDLLSLSRISRQEIRRQVTGLNSLVEEVRAELKEMAAQRGVQRKLEWRIAPLPFVDCDPALMKQVFANLLSNAAKYTRPREHAVIEIGANSQNGETVLFVRDNGVGFSMKYADKLFGVFQRLHRQEDFEGTGVGLATVQRILQKHGGRIWAEAELDKGACFYFTLGSASGTDSEVAATVTATTGAEA